MKQVTYTRTALKELAAIAKVHARLIRAKVEQYATDPAALANQVKKLQGVDVYRLRVGDYRVLFTEDAVVVAVIKIGHRREIYA